MSLGCCKRNVELQAAVSKSIIRTRNRYVYVFAFGDDVISNIVFDDDDEEHVLITIRLKLSTYTQSHFSGKNVHMNVLLVYVWVCLKKKLEYVDV